MAKSVTSGILFKLLSPVVGFLFRRGWKMQQFEEALKRTLLVEAEKEVENANVSRLSVATGIHRRDVMRLWRDELPKDVSSTGVITKVLGAWPRKKRYLSFEGKESEFASLVHTVSMDISPYTVLFELERAKLVRKTEKGLELIANVFQPDPKNIEVALELLVRDTMDLIVAVEQNIFKSQPIKNLHINTEFDNIPNEHTAEIKKALLMLGNEFQAKVRSLLEQYDRDSNPKVQGSGKTRVSVGVFAVAESTECALNDTDDNSVTEKKTKI